MLRKLFYITIVFLGVLTLTYFARPDFLDSAFLIPVRVDNQLVKLSVFEFIDMMFDEGFWLVLFTVIKKLTFLHFDYQLWDHERWFIVNALFIAALTLTTVYILGIIMKALSILPLQSRLNIFALIVVSTIFYWTNGFDLNTTAKVLHFDFKSGVTVPMLPFESELEQMYQYYYRLGIKQYFLKVEFTAVEWSFLALALAWYAWKTHILLSEPLKNTTSFVTPIVAAFTFLFFSLFAPYRLSDDIDKEEMKEITIHQQTSLLKLLGIDGSGYVDAFNHLTLVEFFRDSQSSWFKSIYRFVENKN